MIARNARLVLIVLIAGLALPAAALATPPGANGRIAYGSGGELYSIAPDGTGVARLTWSDTVEQEPSWSPDGTRIAFGSFAEGRQSIHVINADGSDERRVSPDDFGSDDSEPAWSPDGTKIAFGSTRPFNGSWHIWVVNSDGSGLQQVTSEFSTSPAWSPDGSKIAYLTGNAIGVANADGSNAHGLTIPPASYTDERPSWSPDGSRLVFARRATFGNNPQLYVIDATGRSERRLTLTDGASRFPSWSPDGTQIVFTYEGRLSVIGSDGSGVHPLGAGVDDLAPDWGTATGTPSPPNTLGAPTIQIFNPQDRVYPAGYAEPAIYVCESARSFVISCEGDVPFGQPLDMETTGPRTFTVRATDIEGRTSTKTVSFEVLDWRRPTVTVHAPSDGAEYGLGQSVEVDFACADEPGGSGIERCDGELHDGQPLDTSRPGSFTAHFWAVDRAHNVTETSVTYSVVDRTPATITVSSPQGGAVFTLGERVVASYGCDHAVSCRGDVDPGALLDTASVGPKSFTVSARDARGNVVTERRSYRVVYPFSGFSSPLVSTPGFVSLKAGAKVPAKFSLGGYYGLGVVTGAKWTRISCASGVPLGDSSPTDAAGKLSFPSGRYQLLTETGASWANSCRQLAVTLDDGTTQRANVTFN